MDVGMMARQKLLYAMVFTIIATIAISDISYAAEPTRLLSNSQDWTDVYSVMLYGSLAGKAADFLVSDKHATLILGQIPITEHLWVFSSTTAPFFSGYEALLRGRGYSVEEFRPQNINLDLAKRSGVKNFIIVDDSYGYNAVSVAPYAVVSRSFVVFADRTNIDQVESFLADSGAQKVLIYGQVDREVRSALARFNPETINKAGDRFANNIEIVKKYQEIAKSKQAVLTNGEFIEKEIMSGSEPVVFIGSSNVPAIIRDYIKGSDIQVGILIGNELVGTATTIRRQIGISVFVKFAQGARVPRGTISQVEALDMFYLPVYNLNLEFDSMKFNRATNKLEVTLKNTQDQAAYFIGSYTLTTADDRRITIGDSQAVFIDGNEVKTILYSVDDVPEGALNGKVYVIYGESANALEKVIDKDIGAIETVRILDSCEIQPIGLQFSLRKNLFYVDVENIGAAVCYVDAELTDVMVAGEKVIFGHDGTAKIEPKGKGQLRIKAVPELLEEDIVDNPLVNIKLFFGEREISLVKIAEAKFELLLAKADYWFYTLLAVIVLMLALIIWKKRKRKHHQHGH